MTYTLSMRGIALYGAALAPQTLEHRWCLECGEEEESKPFTRLVHGVVTVRCFDWGQYYKTVALYRDRLHVRGLTQEFDGSGRHIGSFEDDEERWIERGAD